MYFRFRQYFEKFWNLKNLNFAWFFYEITLQVFEFCIFELGLRHSRWSKTSFSFWLILSRIWLSLDIQGRKNLHNFHQKSKKKSKSVDIVVLRDCRSFEFGIQLLIEIHLWFRNSFRQKFRLKILLFHLKTDNLSIIPDILIWMV